MNKEDGVEGGEDEGDDEIMESKIHETILAGPFRFQKARGRQKAEIWTSILRDSFTRPHYRPSRQRVRTLALAMGWLRFPHQAQIIPV